MPKYNYKFLSQKEFADLAGVTQVSISRALKRETLVWSYKENGKRDGIDPENPINKAYLETRQRENAGNRVDVQATKDVEKGLGGSTAADPELTQAMTYKRTQDAELIKAKQLKTNVELAIKMKTLIPLDFFDKLWKANISGLHNHVLPIGDRISTEIAAICGVTDPDIVQQVNEYIDDETTTALKLVQDNVKKTIKELGLI